MNYTFENIESLESGNGTDTLIWNTVLKSNYISNMFWGFYSTRDEDALNLLKMLSGNMSKKFLIEVETTEVRDEKGMLVAIFGKPFGLQTDKNGQYIISKETGEKVYFEYHPNPKLKDG